MPERPNFEEIFKSAGSTSQPASTSRRKKVKEAINKFETNPNLPNWEKPLRAVELMFHRFFHWLGVPVPRWRPAGAVILVFGIVGGLLLFGGDLGLAASYTFVQTDWSGGTSALTIGHPTNQTGWTKYSSSTNVDTSQAGQVSFTSAAGNVSETFSATTNRDGTYSTPGFWTTSGQLAAQAGGTFTDYTSQISAAAGTDIINTVAIDTANQKVYLGTNNGKLLQWDPANPTTNATSISLAAASWGTDSIKSLVYNPYNSTVYIIGSLKFAKYVVGGSASDLTSSSTYSTYFTGTTQFQSGIYDFTNNRIYMGSSGTFVQYNPANNTITNKSSKLPGSWSSCNFGVTGSIAFDSTNGAIYLGTIPNPCGAKFGRYDIGADTFTDLTSLLSGQVRGINGLTYDPVNNMIYAQGDYADTQQTFFKFNANYVSEVASGLIGHWKLDENSGNTAADSSGNGFSLTININSARWTIGKMGTSAFDNPDGTNALNGDASYDSLSAYPITVSAWVKSTQNNPNATYFVYKAESLTVNNGYALFFKNGHVRATFNKDENNYIKDSINGLDGGAINDGNWHNVTLVVNASGGTLYVDGNSADSSGWTGTAGAPTVTSTIRIGGALGSPLTGSTDDVRVYNRALSGSEVTSIYNRGNLFTNLNRNDVGQNAYWISTDSLGIVYRELSGLRTFNPSNSTDADITPSGFTFPSAWYDSVYHQMYIIGGEATKFGTRTVSSGTAQSITLDNTSQNITSATLTKTDNVGTGTIKYYLSNDGGTTFAQVTPSTPYTFATTGSDLRFKIVVTGNATVQDVTIDYSGITTGDLTSNAYNTGDAANLITKLAYTGTGESGTLIIKFQIRSAPNSGGVPGAWSNWCGYSDCSGNTYFTTSDNNVNLAGNHPLRSGADDQWFQYKVFFSGTTSGTVTLNDVTITYVVNAPPNFDADFPTTGAGGVSATQVTDSSTDNFGKVKIDYRVRDTDTSTGTATPGFVTPSFQYNIGGGWVNITAPNLEATDLNNKAVDGSNYTTYSAYWRAANQIPNNYLTTAQVRVTINDNEAANNTATATSANFTLDTTPPAVSAFTIDASAGSLTLTATDNTNLQYKLSNNSDLSADGVNGTSGQWQTVGGNSVNLTPNWNFGAAANPTVYLNIRDTTGNNTSRTAIAPSTPSNMDIKDISNPAANSYKLFVSWSVYSAVANASFLRYEIYRSTDGSSFSSLANVTDVNTNYYADFGLTQGQRYYYKVRVVDTDTDKGNWSAVVNQDANGQGGTDTIAPTISSVSVAETQATYAKITWTTDELANSRVDYAVALVGDYDNHVVIVDSYVLSHTLTITGLTPNTNYKFRVKSTDVVGNLATNDNGGSFFSFSTNQGVTISNVTTTSVNDVSATISWNTDRDSDSFVSYSTSPTLSNPIRIGSSTLVGGGGPVYQHRVDITGLTAGVTYYYFVESTDAQTNNAKDTNGNNYYTFTTTLDSQAPVISGVSTPVLAPTAAVVVWNTDEPATTQMSYGTTAGAYTTTTPLDTELTTTHIVALSGLSEKTKYYFIVKSKDSANNESTSGESNFTTGETVVQVVTVSSGGGGSTVTIDTTNPTISSIAAKDLTPFSANITFNSDEESIGLVSYGIDKDKLIQTAGTADFGKEHVIRLSGLKMASKYYYKVTATDKSGNTATSDVKDFETQVLTQGNVKVGDVYQFQQQIEDAIESALPSLVPPFIDRPQVANITDNSATVSWRTNIKSYSVVGYAPEDQYKAEADDAYSVEVSDTENKTLEHQLQLVNLQPNTRYHLMVKSFSIPEVVGRSSDITFVTGALKIKANIGSVTNNSFRATWTTSDATTSVVEYRNTRTGELNQKSSDQKTIGHDILVDNLIPGTTYEVSVFGINAKGNKVTTAAAVKITTSVDQAPPQILSLKIDTAIVPGVADRTQTIVSWKTDEPATSVVYYEEGAGSGTSAEQKPLANKVEITNSYVLDHAIVLSVLKPGGLYRIQIGSTDQAGNDTTLPVKTIVVPRKSESILDVIFKNFEDTFKFLRPQ